MEKTKIPIPNSIDEVTVAQFEAAALLVMELQIFLGLRPRPVPMFSANRECFDFAAFEPLEHEPESVKDNTLAWLSSNEFAARCIAAYTLLPLDAVTLYLQYGWFCDGVMKAIDALFAEFSFENSEFAKTTAQRGVFECVDKQGKDIWLAMQGDITDYATSQVVDAVLQPIEWGNDLKCNFSTVLAFFLRRATIDENGGFDFIEEDLVMEKGKYVLNYEMIRRNIFFLQKQPLDSVLPLFFCLCGMPTMRLRIERSLSVFLRAANQAVRP